MHHVLYHANCHDGFGAAYAAWKYFQAFQADVDAGEFPETFYYPMKYSTPLPPFSEGDDVYLLDYSRKADDLVMMHEQCLNIEIIDHHKTAKPEFEKAREITGKPRMGSHRIQGTFDMEKSGAVLAWERFHPNTKVPKILEHIQDRDLWRYHIAYTKEIHAALCGVPYDFDIWDKIVTGAEGKDDGKAYGYNGMIRRGENILEYHSVLIPQLVAEAQLFNIGGYEVPCSNVSILFSEVPHALLSEYPQAKFAAARYFLGSGEVQYSLRGRGDFDVSEVAKVYGGGGHHNAAGFTILEGSELVKPVFQQEVSEVVS